jgi:uncharacterized protein YggU (UPF0235/DUF167 family)
VDGAANEALRRFLSRLLDLPKEAVTIKTGATSRRKTALIAGLSQGEANSRVLAQINAKKTP